MARIIANRLSRLIEKPNSHNPRQAPASAMGTTMVGMIVARQLCRKVNITMNTSSMATARVITTSLIEALIKGVLS